MSSQIQQQIIISGVGGQGVLFVTRLMAEAAIDKGIRVMTSETHGMAQRGGTVVSHLKVGDFSSPLIRPGQADGLLSLKAENFAQHGAFLKPEGWGVINAKDPIAETNGKKIFCFDADDAAQQIGNVKSLNVIVLGYALAKANLFCSLEDIQKIMKSRLAEKKKLLEASLKAVEIGVKAAG